MRKNLSFRYLFALSFVFVSSLLKAQDYGLFGTATYISPGNASMRAVRTTSSGYDTYGGIDFTPSLPANFTLAQLNNLATDYRAVDGGTGGGSPRFVAEVQAPCGLIAIFFYIPSAEPIPADNMWHNSGNLACPTCLVDVNPQSGSTCTGAYQTPYSSIQALYGTSPVTALYIVTDAGWFYCNSQSGMASSSSSSCTQTVDFDNTRVNTMQFTYEYTSKQQCKEDVDQRKKNFEAQQKADKRAFDKQQQDAKNAFNAQHHTPQERKAFDDQQKAAKKQFDDQQKADKKAFDDQNKADMKACNQVNNSSPTTSAARVGQLLDEVALNEIKLSGSPNPFRGMTKLEYNVPVDSKVVIKVYDLLGREVNTVVNADKKAGTYSETFDGSKLNTGVYYARMITNTEGKQTIQTQKLVKGD